MPQVFRGRTITFALRDDWAADPALPPMLSQQFLTYLFVPQAAMNDGIRYGTLQIREVLNPMEKSTVTSQLQALSNPMMAAAILSNLGVQPQTIAGELQQIEIQGHVCKYRIIDGLAMMTMQPVRCYIGIIDIGQYAVEIIAITMIQIWPLLLPQILEVFTSITPIVPGQEPEAIQPSSIFVNKDEGGNLAYKVMQSDGTLQKFDELKKTQHGVTLMYVDNRTLNIGQDTEIKGQISFGDNSKLEGFTMSGDRKIEISGQAKVGDIFQGDHVQVDKSVKGPFDAKEFSSVIGELLAAIKNTGSEDSNAKLATNELEKAKLQADAGEQRDAVASTMDNAVKYMKKSEEVVKSGVNIGKLLLKAGKILGAAIAWL
jgi:hypothetical protein